MKASRGSQAGSGWATSGFVRRLPVPEGFLHDDHLRWMTERSSGLFETQEFTYHPRMDGLLFNVIRFS